MENRNIDGYVDPRGHGSNGVPAEEKLLWKEAEDLTNLNQEEFDAYNTIASVINGSLEGQDYSISQAIEQFPFVSKGSIGYVALTQCALYYLVSEGFSKEEISELDFPQKSISSGNLEIRTLEGRQGESITLLKYKQRGSEDEEVLYMCEEVEAIPISNLPHEKRMHAENIFDAGYRDQTADVFFRKTSDSEKEF